MLFWTAVYCFFYAINGFQNFVDLTRQNYDGLLIFMGYFGIPLLLLTIGGASWAGLTRNVWLFLWASVLYIPFVALSYKIQGAK